MSILGILIIGLLSSTVVVPSFLVTQFQTSVTYLIAISLILTGGLQLGFTRFVSDRLFEEKDEVISPNLNGILLLVIIAASVVGIIGLFVLLPGTGVVYRILMLAAFVLMCAIWKMCIRDSPHATEQGAVADDESGHQPFQPERAQQQRQRYRNGITDGE